MEILSIVVDIGVVVADIAIIALIIRGWKK